jgi:hypothetical protein
MTSTNKTFAVAIAVSSLAIATTALAQSPPGAPRIYDAARRPVGIALAFAPGTGQGRVLLTFDRGDAVLNIGPEGLYRDATTTPSVKASGAKLYFGTADCSDPGFVRVQHFLNYADFLPAGPERAGFTRAGTVVYAARPFREETLRAEKSDGVCKALPAPPETALVGAVASAPLRSFKLPFLTK